MAAKLALFVMFFLVIVYIAQAAPPQTEKSTQETIDDTLKKISTGFDDIVGKIKNSEFIQETGKALTDLGKKIQETGQSAIDKLKAPTPSS